MLQWLFGAKPAAEAEEKDDNAAASPAKTRAEAEASGPGNVADVAPAATGVRGVLELIRLVKDVRTCSPRAAGAAVGATFIAERKKGADLVLDNVRGIN